MAGSIGKIAEEVLNEVKEGELVKLAERKIIKNAGTVSTELGNNLMKLAAAFEAKEDSVSVEELSQFVRGGNDD